MADDRMYKKIVTLANACEAEIFGKMLTEHGIPHRVRSYHDSAYDGLYQATKGWGHVEAPAEYKEEIKALYRGLPGEILPEDQPQFEEDSPSV
jgi:hypothetical protein